VLLDDGTYGMIPEQWLAKFAGLAGTGTVEGDNLRFQKHQTGLLDALLSAQPEANCDAVFEHAREELRSFEGIKPAEAPEGFQGALRAYQKDGLGWLHFLQRFSFGGCLADDMGLGKTVQVLALLESQRLLRATEGPERPPPSLVVVPRSLVFNWIEEARRFTPALRVADHTRGDRPRNTDGFDQADVILATYGTLRRDVPFLKDYTFDYCILDEAQAIKNAESESAKAARLIQAQHRLAMSGTPIENHLGELWSLFEFLNPGMLGTASLFQASATRNPDPEARALLARGLRPFILRRTKDQVARDLPAKTEQTLYCELDADQRRRYNELRDFYRGSLLKQVELEGAQKHQMQILEALLRLRQVACHPGLLDAELREESSAKFEALLPQLDELIDENHKVLVFSQFVQLLSILKGHLDRAGIPYEYLDGQTRNRQEHVARFQGDPDCRLFLISLKAGGLGLNLTAAEYVFLLDPWWNPAVEAQAIDRAHRIGQTRPVFAYRLIARDTVEEKILQLQQSKRDLADAIINADNSFISGLGKDDLERLLS
jgi:SNF2 family DNA or RNA helicase